MENSEATAVERDGITDIVTSLFNTCKRSRSITVRLSFLRMLRQPMLNNLRIRVTLHKSSIDPLGALDTLSSRDDKLARLSLVEGSCESLLPVNDYIARLCDVLLDRAWRVQRCRHTAQQVFPYPHGGCCNAHRHSRIQRL